MGIRRLKFRMGLVRFLEVEKRVFLGFGRLGGFARGC